MKLAASILIASVNAQFRQRENKEAEDGNDTGSTFADYFGGYDYGGGFDGGVFDYSGFDDQAFGDYNDAFGTDAPTTAAAATTQAPTDAPTEDPFAGYDFSGADDAFASYDGADDSASLDDTVADIVADVVEAAAGRPDAAPQEEEKSSAFLQSLNTLEAGSFANGLSFCFISEGNNDVIGQNAVTDWFATGGQWVNCPEGENESCQITISKIAGTIERVQSQCANASSCVANMRQNFSPRHTETGSVIFDSWTRQQCRPHFEQDAAKKFNGELGVGARARAAGSSVCTFCVDVCRSEWVFNGEDGDGTPLTQEQLNDSQCIGRSGGFDNSKPINNEDVDDAASAAAGFDLFDEDTHFSAATYAWSGAYSPMSSDNFYSTSLMTQRKTNTDGTTVSRTFEISNLQAEQIMHGLANGYGDVADDVPAPAAGAEME